jgi:hypothetical protein
MSSRFEIGRLNFDGPERAHFPIPREEFMSEQRWPSGQVDQRKMAFVETIRSILQRKGNEVW